MTSPTLLAQQIESQAKISKLPAGTWIDQAVEIAKTGRYKPNRSRSEGVYRVVRFVIDNPGATAYAAAKFATKCEYPTSYQAGYYIVVRTVAAGLVEAVDQYAADQTSKRRVRWRLYPNPKVIAAWEALGGAGGDFE